MCGPRTGGQISIETRMVTHICCDPPNTFPVLSVSVHLIEDYSDWLISRLNHQSGTHVVTLNSEMAMLADQTPELATVIQAADLVVPDGAGVVFYLRLRGQMVQRCPGIELVESLLQQVGSVHSFFFFGGAPGVAEAAVHYWQQRVPDLKLAGVSHGYLSSEQVQDLEETLITQQPQVILVGMGVPRQEFWIQEHRALCPNAVWIGVGGSFDVWAGLKSRAPVWMRNSNLEWMYRLYKEPWRWRRMLVLPRFAWRAFWER